jgi:hypothetical protein
MDPNSPIAAALAALGSTGIFGYQHYGTVSCEGRFGQFYSSGMLSSEPGQLTFVVDWQMPGIVTDTGVAGRITAITPITVAFEVQYPTFKANYFINRIDGTITETSNFGGAFRGTCDLNSLRTRF